MKHPGHSGFLLFLASAAIILIVAPLFQQGLFIDGLLYKTAAHNFYSGEASFWWMKFSDVSMKPFCEQPPLFIFLTGAWYEVFAEGHVADKMFTLLLFIAAIVLLRSISSFLFSPQAGDLACLFLIAVPVIQWSYVNQVIETLALPLALLTFLCFLQFTRGVSNKRWLWLPCFVAGIILLFLTKGFQSCFLIVAPFLFFIFKKGRSNLLFGLGAASLLLLVLGYLLFLYPPSSQWFQFYLNKRLLASLQGAGATTDFRLEIIIRTLTELIIPLGLCLLAWLFRRKQAVPLNEVDKKIGWILLLTGISGSFPFAITFEQRGFYLLPSFPFYILAFIAFFQPVLLFYYEKVLNFFADKRTRFLSVILIICALAYWVYSPRVYKREENLISDLRLIQPFFQEKERDTISIDEDSWNDTALQSYLYMMARVNVATDTLHRFYIHDRSHNTVANPAYRKVNLPTAQYDFFEKVSAQELQPDR